MVVNLVKQEKFRADLYYRISVVPLILPPLRERPGDPPELAAYFLAKFGEENGLDLHFAPSAFDVLCRCAFPGNVRELENCVRRTAALAAATEIQDNARSLWREQSIEKLRSNDYSGWAIRRLASSMPLTQILPSTTAVGKDRNWAPSQGPPVQNPDCALNFA
jgi:Nif-specific regulatory protein